MGKRMKKVGPTRGFGSRYGSSVRKRYIKIVTDLRKRYECPQCENQHVQRVSVGVWKCKKCEFTFAGGAYVPTTKLGIVAERLAKRGMSEREI